MKLTVYHSGTFYKGVTRELKSPTQNQHKLTYTEGLTVEADGLDLNPDRDCGQGIKFCRSIADALNWGPVVVELSLPAGTELVDTGSKLRAAAVTVVKVVDLCGADLYGANLCGANLYGADLRSANLYGANLYGANLRSANLRGANLYGANLRSANLGSANLRSADLCGANLYGANLYGANLGSANLRSANLYGANLYGANLGSANLGETQARGAYNIPSGYTVTDGGTDRGLLVRS